MAVRVRVRVPATSANLGPGLDALGLALALYNDVEVVLAPTGATVAIDGEGSERFATGEGNLVVRSARAALDALGVPPPGLDLRCTNRIPGARGLGSSAAAIVAGVAAGAALASPHQPLDIDWALDLCARLEGHPDNVAACLLGGVTVAWYEAGGRARAVRADPAPDLVAVLLVPAVRVSTARARQLLPATVTLADAAHSAGRAALAALALTSRTDLLLPSTEDRLHQAYRTAAMPSSLGLLERLRGRGLAATISGAGPSVLVLAGGAGSVSLLADIVATGVDGFDVMASAPEPTGVQVTWLGEA
jgi:homoserine kinase